MARDVSPVPKRRVRKVMSREGGGLRQPAEAARDRPPQQFYGLPDTDTVGTRCMVSACMVSSTAARQSDVVGTMIGSSASRTIRLNAGTSVSRISASVTSSTSISAITSSR